MNYGAIKNCDIANGVGVRVTLFVSGCRNACEGCFQPETWSFSYVEEFTEEIENKIIAMLEPSYIRGLTILGGEPFEPENQERILPLVKRVRETYPLKDIWMFSGFTFEEMHDKNMRCCTPFTDEILTQIDVLVDGRFVLAKRNLSLQFRGSENQRIIDIPSTLAEGRIIPWQG